jgi:hypothetical protein
LPSSQPAQTRSAAATAKAAADAWKTDATLAVLNEEGAVRSAVSGLGRRAIWPSLSLLHRRCDDAPAHVTPHIFSVELDLDRYSIGDDLAELWPGSAGPPSKALDSSAGPAPNRFRQSLIPGESDAPATGRLPQSLLGSPRFGVVAGGRSAESNGWACVAVTWRAVAWWLSRLCC